MEDRIILLCGLVLIMTKQCLGAAEFVDARCESSGKISYRIKGAANLYLRSSLCSNKILITKNAIDWYTINGANCDYTLDVGFTAQLTGNEFGIFNAATGDLSMSYKCSANGLPAQKLNFDFSGLTQMTGPPVVIPVAPEVTVAMYLADCMTPVTTPIHPGEPLCMLFRIEDGFQGMSMQIQEIKVRSPGKGWYVLTGGDGMPGCATYDFFHFGIWPQLEQYPTPAIQRAMFPAFMITESTDPEEQQFQITLLICQHPSFAQCDTNYQGCLPALPGTGRRKRDLHNTAQLQFSSAGRRKRDIDETTQLLLSASMWVTPGNGTGKVLSNTGSNSDTNTDDNDRDHAAQPGRDAVGSDVEAARQTGTETCEVCMKRSVLYGLIGFFIPALVLAFGASACLWWRTRNQIRKVEETEIITRKPGSMCGSSFRNSGYTH